MELSNGTLFLLHWTVPLLELWIEVLGTGAAGSSPSRRRRAPGGGGGAILAPSYGRAVVRARPTPRRRCQGRSHRAPRVAAKQGAVPDNVERVGTLSNNWRA